MITTIICLCGVIIAQYFFIKKLLAEIDLLNSTVKLFQENQECDRSCKESLNELALLAFERMKLLPGGKKFAEEGIKYHINRRKDYAPKKK